MSDISWWALPVVAAVSAGAAAVTTMLVTARGDDPRGRSRRWYEERRTAYIGLLAVFDRVVYRLRTDDTAGGLGRDPVAYLDEVGPALMRVRLLASGPVRSAALAVHAMLTRLHESVGPAQARGVDPDKHFRELLVQVPLVMQEFEVAVREELDISAAPPALPGDDPGRSLLRRTPG